MSTLLLRAQRWRIVPFLGPPRELTTLGYFFTASTNLSSSSGQNDGESPLNRRCDFDNVIFRIYGPIKSSMVKQSLYYTVLSPPRVLQNKYKQRLFHHFYSKFLMFVNWQGCGKIKTIKAGSLWLYALHSLHYLSTALLHRARSRVSLCVRTHTLWFWINRVPHLHLDNWNFKFVFIMLSYQSGLFRNLLRHGYVGDVLKYPRDQPSSNREPFSEEISFRFLDSNIPQRENRQIKRFYWNTNYVNNTIIV